MSDRWYYQLLLEEFGPVSAAAVRQLHQDGTLSSGDLVRAEGTEEWIPVSSMPVTEDTSEPAVISDLSELAFDFEDSGAPANPTASQASASPGLTRAPVPEYYTQSLGQILGPMTEADLIGMAETGALDHADLVRLGDDGEWKVADEWPNLAMALAQGASIFDAPVSSAPLTARRLFQTAGRPAEKPQKSEVDGEAGDRVGQAPETAAAADTAESVSKEDTAKVHTAKDPNPPEAKAAQAAVDEADTDFAAERKAGRRKTKKSKSAREEDKLLNEIFDDVFADGEKAARSPMPAAASASAAGNAAKAASASSGDAGSVPGESVKSALRNSPAENSPVTANDRLAASSLSSASAIASNAGAELSPVMASPVMASPPTTSPQSPRSAPAPVPYSPPKAKRSFQFDGAVRNLTIGIGVVIVAAVLWQFGVPGLGGISPGRYSSRLKEVMTQYKSMGDNPSQPQWQELSSATRTEFMTYYKAMLEAGASGGNNAALVEAMKSVIALASLSFEDKEQRAALMEKAEKSVGSL